MQFKQIIGQSIIKQHLIDQYNIGRIAHATMLIGPEGSGTLPLAIAYAQFINCTGDKSNGDSCGTCPSCRKFTRLSHPDLHFIFPTINKDSSHCQSEDFLEEWREQLTESPYFNLQTWVARISSETKQPVINTRDAEAIHKALSMTPFEADYQVLIMWKPELMNQQTANKILKILEEPPAHTLFILASESTTEILPTILSRTQRINVPPIALQDIANYVKAKGYDEPTANNIAHVSNGNFNKTLSLIGNSTANNENFEFFKSLMRTCWTGAAPNMSLVTEAAGKDRETLKNNLYYSLRMIRENFVRNTNEPSLYYLTTEEQEFSNNFAPYVHLNNVFELSDSISEAIRQLEQNGNVKIILFDLMLHLATLIRRRERPQ